MPGRRKDVWGHIGCQAYSLVGFNKDNNLCRGRVPDMHHKERNSVEHTSQIGTKTLKT